MRLRSMPNSRNATSAPITADGRPVRIRDGQASQNQG
jgi:hypothetical protein